MSFMARLALVLLAGNLALGGWFHTRWRSMDGYRQRSQAEVARMQAQVRALQQVVGDARDLQAEIAGVQQKVAEEGRYMGSRWESMYLLNEVAAIGRQSGTTVVGYNLSAGSPHADGVIKNSLALEVRAPGAEAYVRFLSVLQERIPGIRPVVSNLPGEQRETQRTFTSVIYSHEGVVRP